jgi:integrase
MGRKKGGARVLGPYERRDGRWQVVGSERSGARTCHTFANRREASEFARAARAALVDCPVTIAEGIERYEQRLIDKGNKEYSRKLTLGRMRRFFAPVLKTRLEALTVKRAGEIYRALVDEKDEHGRPTLAPDSHRNYLAEARTFLRWCVSQDWITENVLEEVDGVGRRRHGKPQLRLDEARKWMAVAMRAVRSGEGAGGPLAALCTLLLGVRASEITTRQVRDLDDGGRLLWIPDAKTPAGRRQLEVPRILRAPLRAQVRGRAGTAPMFPADGGGLHWRDWPREWVQRLCARAGVPEVTAHGMRGLHSTLAVERGATGPLVANALGHEDEETTNRSYVKRGTRERANSKRAQAALTKKPRGPRRPNKKPAE